MNKPSYPSNVVNILGMKLYPKDINVNACYIQNLGEPPMKLYGKFKPCGKCNGTGKLFDTANLVEVGCNGCNNFGILMVFLPSEPTEVEVSPPLPTG